MIKFPLTELLDEQACYEWLLEILHPKGLYPTFSRLFKTKNNIYEKRHRETAKLDFVDQ
jgi:hypothetical protein